METGSTGLTLDKKLLLTAVVLLAASSFTSIKGLSIDYTVVRAFNSLSQKSYLLDHGADEFSRASLSGAILVAMIWYAWFGTKDLQTRAGIVVGFIAASIGGFISRAMQVMLPTHPRPMQDAHLQFLPPSSVGKNLLHDFSSFPSDHASVYFGLATVILLANRKAGYWAMALATIICISRVYLGLHFPSDLVGGAGVGMLLVCAVYGLRKSAALQRLISEPKYKPLFYAIAFYFSYNVAMLFADFRDIAAGFGHAMSHIQ